MLTSDTYDRYDREIGAAVERDRALLDEAISDVRRLVFQPLGKRTMTAFSLVASDGGHNKLSFNPFKVTVIRVVDSNGKELFTDAVSPTTDLDVLTDRLRQDPKNPLARLMDDLGVDKLKDLSPMFSADNQSEWVLDYRDICEWAALYDRIVHRDHANNLIYLRDGLLRSKKFSGELFIRMYEKMKAAIERNKNDEKVDIYLVGVAKHTEIHERYELALTLAGDLPDGVPCYAPIPYKIQEKVYSWGRGEWVRAPDDYRPDIENPKFNMGSMHFVRFGPKAGDRIFTVDVLHSQKGSVADILAYAVNDARDGFPTPHYPLSVQQADQYAQIADFDRQVLSDLLADKVKGLVEPENQGLVEAMRLNVDTTARRYA